MLTENPTYRATVRRDGTVRLVPWMPCLVEGGPLLAMFRARAPRGLAVADVRVRHEDGQLSDAVVRFLVGDAPRAREALGRWASTVGYARIWFADEVVDLEPVAPGLARTRCSGCGTVLEDDDPAFWTFVREGGAFPPMCTLCGCDLPQWTVVAPVRVRVSDLHGDDRPS